MSNDDLEWLYPDVDYVTAAKNFITEKTQLVVITRGADGIEGFTQDGEVSAAGVKVTVVDTVGAGDTVGAILVEGIVNHGLDNLVGPVLQSVLNRAAYAAAITCSRAGANPPTFEELKGH